MRHLFGLLAVFAFAALIATPAAAQILMQGSFVAEARCPALQSIRNQTNPGAVATEPGASYDLIGRNTDPATHYYLVVPGASPERRWVAVGCGRLATVEDRMAGGGGPAIEVERSPDASGAASDSRSPSGRYVLAASWHASFCEGAGGRPECRSGGIDDRFTLHGLWPDGEAYCGKFAAFEGRRWSELPEPKLTAGTRRALEAVMPGTRANLQRHQWAKHGSCYGTDAEAYFSDSIALIDKLNASPVARLFTSSRDEELSADEIRASFDEAFGRGAGSRVLVDCARDDDRTIIAELRINVAGAVRPQSHLGDLIMKADRAPRGCPAGIVDRHGDQ